MHHNQTEPVLHAAAQPKIQLKNVAKTVTSLITGAAQGLGYALSAWCQERQQQVVLIDKNLPFLLQQNAITLHKSKPPICLQLDLANNNQEQYKNLLETLVPQLSGLNNLFLNAATLGQLGPIAHYSWDIWQQTIQVNLNSNFLLCQTLLPLLRANSSRENPAQIFFILDETANYHAYWGAYRVAKAGLKQLAKILQQELSYANIKVHCLYPPPLETQLRQQAFPGEDPKSRKVPLEIVNQLLDGYL